MLPVLTGENREALCRRCGIACHTPILLGSKIVVIPEIHCRFLIYDERGQAACSVYDKRREVAPWCRTAEEAVPLNALAHDCPYAAGAPGFKGKRWAKDWERDAIAQAMRAKLATEGLSAEDSPQSAMKLLDGEWACEESEDGARFVFRKIADSPCYP